MLGFRVWSLFCYAVLSVLSCFASILMSTIKLVALCFIESVHESYWKMQQLPCP